MRLHRTASVVGALMAVGLLIAGCSSSSTSPPSPRATPSSAATSAPTPTLTSASFQKVLDDARASGMEPEEVLPLLGDTLVHALDVAQSASP